MAKAKPTPPAAAANVGAGSPATDAPIGAEAPPTDDANVGAGSPATDAPIGAEAPPTAAANVGAGSPATDAPIGAEAPPTDESTVAAGLRITAAREGFRRAGRAWSKQPTDVPLADLSDDQVAMLRAEPMLAIEEVVV